MAEGRLQKCWTSREKVDEVRRPASPAGASPLDELYLDAIAGGASPNTDFDLYLLTNLSCHPLDTFNVCTGNSVSVCSA